MSDGGENVVSKDGVTVRKRHRSVDGGNVAVVYEIESRREEPVWVELSEPVEGDWLQRFHPDFGGQCWTRTATGVRFQRQFEPGERYTTVFGLGSIPGDQVDILGRQPTVEVQEGSSGGDSGTGRGGSSGTETDTGQTAGESSTEPGQTQPGQSVSEGSDRTASRDEATANRSSRSDRSFPRWEFFGGKPDGTDRGEHRSTGSDQAPSQPKPSESNRQRRPAVDTETAEDGLALDDRIAAIEGRLDELVERLNSSPEAEATGQRSVHSRPAREPALDTPRIQRLRESLARIEDEADAVDGVESGVPIGRSAENVTTGAGRTEKSSSSHSEGNGVSLGTPVRPSKREAIASLSDDFSNRLAGVDERIDGITTALTRQRERVDELESLITDHRQDLDAEISEIKAALASNMESLYSHDTAIDEIQGSVEGLSKSLDSIEGEAAERRDVDQHRREEIEALETAITEREGVAAELRSAVERCDDRLDRVDHRLSTMTGQIEALESTVKASQSDISALSAGYLATLNIADRTDIQELPDAETRLLARTDAIPTSIISGIGLARATALEDHLGVGTVRELAATNAADVADAIDTTEKAANEFVSIAKALAEL